MGSLFLKATPPTPGAGMSGANDLMEPLVLRIDPEAVEPVGAAPNTALPAANRPQTSLTPKGLAVLFLTTAISAVATPVLWGSTGYLSTLKVPLVPRVLLAAVALLLAAGAASGRLSVDTIATIWGCVAPACALFIALNFALFATHDSLVAFKESEARPTFRNAYRALFFVGAAVTTAMPRSLIWKVAVMGGVLGGVLITSTVLTVRLEDSATYLFKSFFDRAVPLLLGFAVMHLVQRLHTSERHIRELEEARRSALGSQLRAQITHNEPFSGAPRAKVPPSQPVPAAEECEGAEAPAGLPTVEPITSTTVINDSHQSGSNDDAPPLPPPSSPPMSPPPSPPSYSATPASFPPQLTEPFILNEEPQPDGPIASPPNAPVLESITLRTRAASCIEVIFQPSPAGLGVLFLITAISAAAGPMLWGSTGYLSHDLSTQGRAPLVLAVVALFLAAGAASKRLSFDTIATFWGCVASACPLFVALNFGLLATHDSLAAFKELEPTLRNAVRTLFFAGAVVTTVMPRSLDWKVAVLGSVAGGLLVASIVLTVRLEESAVYLFKFFFNRVVPLYEETQNEQHMSTI